MTSKTKSLVTILWIGLLAGTLDITDNLIFNELRGITPTMVLKQHKKVEEQEATINHQAALIYTGRTAESFHCASQRAGLENPSGERGAPTGGTVGSGG